MLSAILLLALSLPAMRVKIPLPDHPPTDFQRYGCDIAGPDPDLAESYPLAVWVEIRGLAPLGAQMLREKTLTESMLGECRRHHSWCDLYSAQPSQKKAMKDCSKWLGGVKKLLGPK